MTRTNLDLAAILVCMMAGGCLSPHSFPMNAQTLCIVGPADLRNDRGKLAARDWAARVHASLAQSLPESSRDALTSDTLRQPNGKITDVYAHFGLQADRIDSFLGNWSGVMTTAQSVPMEEAVPDESRWAGYTSIEIPMDDGIKLMAHSAPPIGPDLGGSHIVITHGLFGKQAGVDQLNIAHALREFGHHVVAVDMRGHGRTLAQHPDAPITFGVDECRDLIAISRWLQNDKGAKRVGLLCFSFTGFEGLMAAWLDSDPTVNQTHPTAIWRAQPQPAARPAFDGGIMVVSPAINIVSLADQMETEFALPGSPLRSSLQSRIKARLRARGAPESHRMWGYIEYELSRSPWMKHYPNYPALSDDVRRFTDFSRDWDKGAARLANVRTPILVLHAANDPTPGSAQAVAEVFGRASNPNCGAIVIRGGGHTGFAAHCAPYYYSLMKAFFDPATAPAALTLRPPTQ